VFPTLPGRYVRSVPADRLYTLSFGLSDRPFTTARRLPSGERAESVTSVPAGMAGMGKRGQGHTANRTAEARTEAQQEEPHGGHGERAHQRDAGQLLRGHDERAIVTPPQ
jgi:hypothetical protein